MEHKSCRICICPLESKGSFREDNTSVGTLAKSAQNMAVCQRMVFFPLPLPQFASLLKIFQADPGNFCESLPSPAAWDACVNTHRLGLLILSSTQRLPEEDRQMLHTSKIIREEVVLLFIFLHDLCCCLKLSENLAIVACVCDPSMGRPRQRSLRPAGST